MSITRLSGGLTPADGSDPRTFPTIFNATADEIESQGSAIVALENGVVGGTAVYRYVDTIYDTSNGTFSKADYPWLRAVRVKVQGAGGGSGGAEATGVGQVSLGGGGAGGVYAESFITNITGLAGTVTVTRGAGGAAAAAGANNGSSGGSSSFGSLVSANGGGGGSGGNFSATVLEAFAVVPAGPTTGTGDLVVPGGAGIPGFHLTTTRGYSSGGGASFLSPPEYRSVAGAGNNAFAGKSFGGGASGPVNATSQTGKAGAAGGNGIVIVELYA
jgi:hypothetical protein